MNDSKFEHGICYSDQLHLIQHSFLCSMVVFNHSEKTCIYFLVVQVRNFFVYCKLWQDRDGSMQFHCGTAAVGSLVCSDDPNIILAACGKC